jgi:hypothetical protein
VSAAVGWEAYQITCAPGSTCRQGRHTDASRIREFWITDPAEVTQAQAVCELACRDESACVGFSLLRNPGATDVLCTISRVDEEMTTGPEWQICSISQDVDTNTLTRLGAGRCKANGSMLPLSNYVTATSKAQCLSDCEADPNCIAAMPAYDYYCQHYMTADVAGGLVDDFNANYQTQWECYAKSNPDKIVTMKMKAHGWTEADFNAKKDDVRASLAGSLGVTAGQVELSLTPFTRRALVEVENDTGLDIFARVKAREADMEAITAKTNDLRALSERLSEDIEGANFEVSKTETQNFGKESITTNQASADKTKGVSMEIFVIVALVCLIVGLGGGVAGYAFFTQKSESANFDPEMGAKRLPEEKSQISLQEVCSNKSTSHGGTTLM